jgi:hypothetical protein
MTADLVLFVTGVVVGAFLAGVVFGGQYLGFVLAAGYRRRGDE